MLHQNKNTNRKRTRQHKNPLSKASLDACLVFPDAKEVPGHLGPITTGCPVGAEKAEQGQAVPLLIRHPVLTQPEVVSPVSCLL